jgi:hypothetical protein
MTLSAWVKDYEDVPVAQGIDVDKQVTVDAGVWPAYLMKDRPPAPAVPFR